MMTVRTVRLAVALLLLLASIVVAPQRSARAQVHGAATPPSATTNGVSAFGTAAHHGPVRALALARSVVGIAAPPGGDGYWTAASDGGVFAFGRAHFHGSMALGLLAAPIVGLAAPPARDGYWLVGADGGVFTFGDLPYAGGMANIPLAAPMVGVAATPTGRGYWLASADGGVFAFGDARFAGSLGNVVLAASIVGIAASPSGRGYWLVAADGGVFAFGDAPFRGSAVTDQPEEPIVGMATAGDAGYWLVNRAGQIFAFGPPDLGSVESFVVDPSTAPTVAIAADGAGGYWLAHGVRSPLDRTSEGPRVLAAQRRLRALGYWLGIADGVFGPLTEQAVDAFQKAERMPVTGTLDATTEARLAVARRPAPRSTSGDLVEVDKTRQLLFVVRDGETKWLFNTSTGTEQRYFFDGTWRRADTPTGHFSVLRQVDGVRVAPLGRLYRPKYFTNGGHAIHGYSHVPPEPASHGCVRVTNGAIDFIWADGLAPLGSPVWVYGTSPS